MTAVSKERMIPGTNKYFPYVFVGDDAFPLKTYLMKPYPRGTIRLREKIANYRTGFDKSFFSPVR